MLYLSYENTYIRLFDDKWSCEKQQSYFDECANRIKDIIDTDISATDVDRYSTIDKVFDKIKSTIATAVTDNHIEPEGYQIISLGLSQLRQTIVTLFSRLMEENKEMKTKITNIEARLTIVEADSLAI